MLYILTGILIGLFFPLLTYLSLCTLGALLWVSVIVAGILLSIAYPSFFIYVCVPLAFVYGIWEHMAEQEADRKEQALRVLEDDKRKQAAVLSNLQKNQDMEQAKKDYKEFMEEIRQADLDRHVELAGLLKRKAQREAIALMKATFKDKAHSPINPDR